MTQTVTSSEFNRQIGKMKQASSSCPVVITERGKPAYVLSYVLSYVLLSYEHYEKMIAYEPDDGDLTDEQMNAIRKAVPQQNFKSVKSLFGKE